MKDIETIESILVNHGFVSPKEVIVCFLSFSNNFFHRINDFNQVSSKGASRGATRPNTDHHCTFHTIWPYHRCLSLDELYGIVVENPTIRKLLAISSDLYRVEKRCSRRGCSTCFPYFALLEKKLGLRCIIRPQDRNLCIPGPGGTNKPITGQPEEET